MGTILPFTGNLSDIPRGWHLCDGTDGTPNLVGQFLQGSNVPGSYIDASLPNIKGRFLGGSYNAYASSLNTNEATYLVQVDAGVQGGSGGHIEDAYGIDASRCSPVYKNDCDTVQPPAYTVYYIIKIK